MISRETLKRDIDTLPEEAPGDSHKHLLMQKVCFGAFGNDTDYLNSIKGMPEKIIAGMNEPLGECIPADKGSGSSQCVCLVTPCFPPQHLTRIHPQTVPLSPWGRM